MRSLCIALCAAVLLAFSSAARAQDSRPPAPPSRTLPDAPTQKGTDAEGELQKALASAGNDSTALVRNLKEYLRKFPDAPKKASVYRALGGGLPADSRRHMRARVCRKAHRVDVPMIPR